jgi:hypothetical protein
MRSMLRKTPGEIVYARPSNNTSLKCLPTARSPNLRSSPPGLKLSLILRVFSALLGSAPGRLEAAPFQGADFFAACEVVAFKSSTSVEAR